MTVTAAVFSYTSQCIVVGSNGYQGERTFFCRFYALKMVELQFVRVNNLDD